MAKRNFDKENKYMHQVFETIPELPEDIEDFVRDIALPDSRFLFTYRDKKTNIRYGYCDRCGVTSQLTDLRTYTAEELENGYHKHNEGGFCPNCLRLVTFKDAGRGRGQMYFYSKIIIPFLKDDGIFFRIFDVCRNYRHDHYTKVETSYTEEYRAFFILGKATMWKRNSYYGYFKGERRDGLKRYFDEWSTMASISRNAENQRYIYNLDNLINNLIPQSSLKYSNYKAYRKAKSPYDTIFGYLEVFAKYYNVVEKFEKSGFERLVYGKISRYDYINVVNWRAKTLQKALDLNNAEIKMLKTSDTKTIKTYKLLKTMGYIADTNTIEKLKKKAYSITDNLTKLIKVKPDCVPCKKIIDKYLKSKKTTFLSDYIDYLGQCQDLNFDLNNKEIAWPKNLKKAHDETNTLINLQKKELAEKKHQEELKKHAKLMEKFEKRFEELNENLYYESSSFFIRPAKTYDELVSEGITQNICVGDLNRSYWKSHAQGKEAILFIRKINEPDQPFYCVQLDPKTNYIIQTRGKGNRGTTEEVQTFLELFEKEKLNNIAAVMTVAS